MQKESNHISFEWRCPFWVLWDIYRSGGPGGIRAGPSPTGWSLCPREHLDATSGSREPPGMCPAPDPLEWQELGQEMLLRVCSPSCPGLQRFTVFWRDRVILQETGAVTSWVVPSSFPSWNPSWFITLRPSPRCNEIKMFMLIYKDSNIDFPFCSRFDYYQASKAFPRSVFILLQHLCKLAAFS